MKLPIKTFWLMSANIDRILAQKDMRALTVAVCGQGGEAAKDHRKQLVLEIGSVVKTDELSATKALMNAERDESGFAELKIMAAQ